MFLPSKPGPIIIWFFFHGNENHKNDKTWFLPYLCVSWIERWWVGFYRIRVGTNICNQYSYNKQLFLGGNTLKGYNSTTRCFDIWQWLQIINAIWCFQFRSISQLPFDLKIYVILSPFIVHRLKMDGRSWIPEYRRVSSWERLLN